MRAALFLIVLICMGPYLFFNDGSIRKDFSLRGETLNIALIPTTDRKCTSTIGIFHQCSYKYELNGEALKQNYNMFAFGSPDTIMLMQGQTSGRLTSTTGQEYLWNRLLTIIFGMILSLYTLKCFLSWMLKPSTAEQTREGHPHRAKPQPQPQPYQRQTPVQRSTGNRAGKGSFGTRNRV